MPRASHIASTKFPGKLPRSPTISCLYPSVKEKKDNESMGYR